ncbi:hypothetical protein PF003_g40299 [Phytophthora fragariae]|nr:hypothetical protein PF003_g40299 [Phytophthora fragariae]
MLMASLDLAGSSMLIDELDPRWSVSKLPSLESAPRAGCR